MSSESTSRPLRLLIIWGHSHLDHIIDPAFLRNSNYDCEVVSGGDDNFPSVHQAGPARLWQLRQKLLRGEFDLVVSGILLHVPWPRFKRRTTQIIKTVRALCTDRIRLLDTFWTPWLTSGEVRRRVPIAVIDQQDPSFIVPWDVPLLEASTLYFKVNLPHQPLNALFPAGAEFGSRRIFPLVRKLRPFTYGVDLKSLPATVRPMHERDIDILCTGTIGRPPPCGKTVGPLDRYQDNVIRRTIYERCVALKDKFRVHCVDGMVPRAEYEELLQRAKLVVCTESVGCETGRIYDVSGRGAIPLINWPLAQNYRMLEPDIHAIYFGMIGDDFERMATAALGQPEKLERISEATRAFTLKEKDRGALGEHVVEETLREFARQQSAGARSG